MALEPEPLRKLAEFFRNIGKISEYLIYPIYSPEEDVFELYFSFLELVRINLFEKGKIQDLINQSISIFNSENYPYCISTIGLIMEEQLTQIYETLFRSKCPQGLTLGELLDLIEKEVKNKFIINNPKKVMVIDDIYKRINDSLEQTSSDPLTKKDVLQIIRDILTLVKENHKEVLTKMKSSQQKESLSIFPNKIRDEMDELIMFRNAISHRSRTPIGSFEAIKSIYYISSLMMWWNDEKKSINWDEESDRIIEGIIRRNNPQSFLS
jgi:hypothetical protein